MNQDFYQGSYFFFVCKRRPDAFDQFCLRFDLSLLNNYQSFEILNYETFEMIHSEDTLEGAFRYLDENTDSSFNFYLEDKMGNSFMFCYRSGNYSVMGIPYGCLDSEALLNVLVAFNALYGWGWPDEAPQERFAEMSEAANNPQLPFMRYANNVLVKPSL